jgi:hypothetical protein
MIWTGSAGQLATTYVLLLVPGGLWHSALIGLEHKGLGPGVALAVATLGTAGWLAIMCTPAVRRAVVRAIFPDERPERDGDLEGHDLDALAARVRGVIA